MTVIPLGTAGGPAWWKDGEAGPRAGISTAITVDDAVYIVDFGMGSIPQFKRAGFDITSLNAGFITHLHSDHVVDLPNLVLFGLHGFSEEPNRPLPIYGPRNRGALPPVNPASAENPVPIAPHHPTPGTADMFDLILQIYSTDINDRVLDSLRVSPNRIFQGLDIHLPNNLSDSPPPQELPDLEPFVVFQDDKVSVTATLVQHPPVWPAFAFRFDSKHGSVVISGDTAPCANLVRLAQGAQLLLHEVIDPNYIEERYGDKSDPRSLASKEHHYKSHTIPVDAGRLATQANVQELLLHHLVPGYSKDSVWRKAEETFSGPVHIARDLTKFHIGEK